MTTKRKDVILVIAKAVQGRKGVQLFFPDAPANHGSIVCWEEIGQHGEASIDYYAGQVRPNHIDAEACIRLYERTYGCVCQQVYRQSYEQQQRAWAQ